jgi:hypothetical protein
MGNKRGMPKNRQSVYTRAVEDSTKDTKAGKQKSTRFL